MKIVPITNLETLFTEIESLCDQGFIFRGQLNSEYKLIPSAFRGDKQAEFAKNFPIQEPEIRTWFNNAEIIEYVRLCTPHLDPQVTINPLGQYLIRLMQYNYSLHKFLTEHPNSVSAEDKIFIERRPQSFWVEEKSFAYFFGGYFEASLRIRKPNGTLIRDSYIFEELTAVDETYSQHYGLPTAALDWSFNPYKALYFSIDNDHAPKYDSTSGLFIASQIPAKAMSLYAFRKNTSFTPSPVNVIEASTLVSNPRAEKQEGTFTYFKGPCSFFLNNGRFPIIEDYNNTQAFELIKFIIPRTDTNLVYLADLLEKQSINKKSLGLE